MHSWICCLKLEMLAVHVLYACPSSCKFWYQNISWARRPIKWTWFFGKWVFPLRLPECHSVWYPGNIRDFKRQVYQRTEAIPNDLLCCVMDTVLGQVKECRGGDGGHLKNVILMSWWLHLVVHWIKNVRKLHFFFYISYFTSKQSAVSYPPVSIRPHRKRSAAAGSDLCLHREGVWTVLCKIALPPVKQKAGWRGGPV